MPGVSLFLNGVMMVSRYNCLVNEAYDLDSAKLSARSKQPGHDRTFTHSEKSFVKCLEALLPQSDWEIVDHPRDLSKIISGKYGVIPEASITSLKTGKKMFFEVKKQGNAGNADERACKHHTVQFYREMHAIYGYSYHPFSTIMCEALAVHERYTLKHPFYFEEDNYFCWVDYDAGLLDRYLKRIADKWLCS